MKKTILKHLPRLYIALIAVNGFLIPANAYAAETVADGIQKALAGILLWFGEIAATLLAYSASLVVWSLNLNSTIMESPVVQVGWIISRDIANLGFILVVILIAFATILQFQQYGIKQLLTKLVIAALLINFSLTIAGVFIDFAGVLTSFFIERSIPGNSTDFGQALGTAFKPHSLLGVKDATALQATINASGTAGAGLTSLLFVIIFTLVAFISFLTLAAMFLVRFVALGILLVLAPLAWLFYAFPRLSGLFSKWWSEFLRWVFFAPAASFFIYIAFFTTLNRGGYNRAQQQGSAAAGAVDDTLLIEGFAQTATDMILLVGLLMGGLIVANKMGIAGASIGLKFAKSVARGGTLGLARGAGRVVGGAGGVALRRMRTAGKNKDAKGEGYAQRAVNTLSKIPVLGRAAVGLNSALTRAGEQDQARADTLQKEKYDKMSDSALMNVAKSPALNAMSDVERAAMLAAIAKKGKVSEFKRGDEEAFGALRASAQRIGTTKPLTNVRPDLAIPKEEVEVDGVKRPETKYEAAEKAVGKNRKIEEIEAEAFKAPEVVINLTSQHIERIAREGTSEQRENIINTIRDVRKLGELEKYVPASELENIRIQLDAIHKTTIDSPAWQKHVTKEEVEELKRIKAREKAEEDIEKEAQRERIQKEKEKAKTESEEEERSPPH